MTSAIRFLHDRRILHGDVKMENVFINAKNSAVLGDFGQARQLPEDNDKISFWLGTEGYVGPEYVINQQTSGFKVSGALV